MYWTSLGPCVLTWVFLNLFLHPADSLRMVKLEVPGIVPIGTSSQLFCHFELESDTLYSIKWYKNRIEFYRYLPSDFPPGQKYDLPGIRVDLEKSNGSHVYLIEPSFQTEGNFRCEVSAEAPSFQTITAEKDLHVYQLPIDAPNIQGLEMSYEVGDILNVTCSYGPSKPKPKLSWILNGKELQDGLLQHLPDVLSEEGHLHKSEVKLVMQLGQMHFLRGGLNLACSALIEQLDSTCSRELVIPDINSWTSPIEVVHSAPGQIAPVLSGVKARYSMGEDVDLNCTSHTSFTPTKLKWQINEKHVKDTYLVPFKEVLENETLTSTLGLSFRLSPKHFLNQEVRLRCFATTYKPVRITHEVDVDGGYEVNSGLHVSEKSSMENTNSSAASLTFLHQLILLLCVCTGKFTKRPG